LQGHFSTGRVKKTVYNGISEKDVGKFDAYDYNVRVGEHALIFL